ncbi:sigma-70 family RNA polymerase sigma factor [Stenotrophomonas maltophilia]|jgi:RNA polymerase sigma factor (sigma-70 family)|uniref:RNA polymerase subunit sigma n=1 Tax=Stenotrophomonas maltophilia TaxID=40324 RepID=A0AAP7GRN0_STEMA|nr:MULTISPECIES: sigma-70 family RNA polymerase sigma factor [Stenotrophomonas]MBA0220040.1 sigma-70 family RNA polymerase sigma factor [Stenotrophomonas maltophilia]MBE5271353.1 sigma-70 family RNA polymerase sigma factor [Stenotrophomonas sp. B2]MBH1591141.1 sigma-70 family RNA polymerase sigma factor [Stenotrophomonas maltophilia]MBH1663710.1 sigma-70 family RNA polymerase sigma factor [Stenotrophomonas maltophilia]MBH1834313.1 sigma-70 family RNA polymerase sigma factor [Stenotrophomonas m
MYPDAASPPVPFDTARLVSSSQQPSTDALNWTGDMDAVARLRDRDCFMRIYDHFMPRLCVYLRGLGVPDAVAEELAQECLLKVWLRAGDYDPAQAALSTWLYRIARNLHIDRVRRERSWMQVQAAVEEAAAADLVERSSAEQFADHARLRQRINELPAVQARMVRMSYFEAKSHGEIASILGMPLGTVKSHLRRAFLRLQSRIGGAQ